jgi:hypothetical protein
MPLSWLALMGVLVGARRQRDRARINEPYENLERPFDSFFLGALGSLIVKTPSRTVMSTSLAVVDPGISAPTS